MKLGMQEHVDESHGVQEEIAISFEANAVAFYAQISGLAKDKIGYGIREICTNGWDASRGNFEVHLPTALNPVFRVRDFGTGMTPELMNRVYAKMYASTKRDSNESVGGWGLGRFSPFAYLIGDSGAGSYTVTSYTGGMARTYVMSLASGGHPVMKLLPEVPSNEPTGLEVSFAVRRNDIREYQERARQILWSFSPRPKITPAIDWKEPEIQSQGENWASYKRGTVPFSGPHVRMGCVMYPFDLRQITSTGFLDWNDDVLFDAPIGSLKVTLSREELAYDDRTKATLTALVKNYEDSFIQQLQAKVDAAETLFEAAQVFEDSVEALGSTRSQSLRNVVRWNGMHIGWHVPKDNAKTMVLREGWQQFDKFDDCHVRCVNVVDAKVVIEHNPSYSFSRFVMANLLGEKVLWIRCKRIFREQVLAGLGNPEVIDLDSFKVPVEKRVSKTIRRRKTLMILDGGKAQRVTQEVDMADGGFFIETAPSNSWRRRGNDYFRISDDTPGIASHCLYDVIATAHKFGLVETGQVILIKGADQPALGDNWTWLGEDLIPGLTAKVDVSEFTGLHHKSYNNLDGHLRNLVEVDAITFTHAPEDLLSFKVDLNRLARSLRQNSTISTDTDLAHAALSKLGVTIDKPEVACPLKAIGDRYSDLCRKYQLLQQIVNPPNSYYGRGDNFERHLAHYFELLARPKVDLTAMGVSDVNMDEDHDEDDTDFVVGIDEEDDDDVGHVVGMEEAA